MYGQYPPVTAFIAPINQGTQDQSAGYQVYQSPGFLNGSHQAWSGRPPSDQTQPLLSSQLHQSQYAAYGVIAQQPNQERQQHPQQVWGPVVAQSQAPLTPQCAGHDQWHVPHQQQPFSPSYRGPPGTPTQQGPQPSTAASVHGYHHQRQQSWSSYQSPTPLGSMPPNPNVQGPNAGSTTGGLTPNGSIFAPPQGGSWAQHNQQHTSNANHRSHVKSKRKSKSTGGAVTPTKQSSISAGSSSSSDPSNTPSGPQTSNREETKATAAEPNATEQGSTEALFCEPCEKDFATQGALQAHLDSHEKCPEPDCSFTASRKVLNAHHTTAHGRFSGSGFQVSGWRRWPRGNSARMPRLWLGPRTRHP